MTGLHTLKRMTKRSKQRVGRGQASGRGKQSGRGGKGQTARAGAKIRPALRDIMKKIPKRRGFGKNRGRTVVGDRQDQIVVSLEKLENAFASGAEVTPKTLVAHDVVSARKLKASSVKIVSGGTLTKRFSIKGCAVTDSARVAIEKAGGTIS